MSTETKKAEEIWKKLSAVDCSDRTQSKGNLKYLSWTWAWGFVQDYFPDSNYEFERFDHPSGIKTDAMYYVDETASVHCHMEIEGVKRSMWLPVMDFRNNAIENPNSRDISDAKMRCLTKCLAMFGLGHYIYAGEDIPTGPSETVKKKTKTKTKAKDEIEEIDVPEVKLNGKVRDHGVFIAHDTVIQAINRKEDLQKHFKSNKEELAKLKQSHPDVTEAIVASFKARLATLNK